MTDLLVRGGRVLLPNGELRRADVAVEDGTIRGIAPGLGDASTVVDATDALVVPGLIDVHAHVHWGATTNGAWPDDVSLGGGVTTIVDAGSVGTDGLPGYARFVSGGSVARALCFVNLSRLGMAGFEAAGELLNPAYADPAGAERLLRDFPDVVVGIKVRVSRDVVGERAVETIRLARAAAAPSGSPVMVHIGGSVARIDEVLAELGPGDIVTHFQTPKPNGLLDERGRLHPAAVDARARGVLFDSGHGKTHFSYAVAERLLEEGFGPDLISTDLSATSFPVLRPGLLTVVGKWIALGLPVADALRAVTRTAADAIRRPGLGRIEPGAPADLAVLVEVPGVARPDVHGAVRRAERELAAVATVRDGRQVWRVGDDETGEDQETGEDHEERERV